jgi:hypothetical protein
MTPSGLVSCGLHEQRRSNYQRVLEVKELRILYDKPPALPCLDPPPLLREPAAVSLRVRFHLIVPMR